MKKSFLIGNILILFFTAITPLLNFQNKQYDYYQDIITLKNIEKNSMSDNYINQDGKSYGNYHRVFLDSSNDLYLPVINNVSIERIKNYIIGKGNKREWYEYVVEGLSLDTIKYAKNKTEFLKKYKVCNITYLYMYNLWNSTSKWINNCGKNVPYTVATKMFNLSENNWNEQVLFAEAHKNREKIRLIIDQFWEGNILKINWRIGVFYDWTMGSFIHHAALVGFMNDSYTLIKPQTENKINYENDMNIIDDDFELINSTFNTPYIESISEDSSFNIYDEADSNVEGVAYIDEKLKNKSQEEKIKSSNFIFSPLLIQNYTDSVEIEESWTGKRYHTLTIFVVWFYNELNIDTTKILKGENLSLRNITAHFSPLLSFSYKNKTTDSSFIPSYYWGKNIKGKITIPFMYGNVS